MATSRSNPFAGEPSAARPKAGFEIRGEDSFALNIPDKGISLVAERVRRERHDLLCELGVYCTLPGARVVNGPALIIANLNLSSLRARQDWAKLLEARANASDLDWVGVMEEFCQRVIEADRTGSPAVDLRTLSRPAPDDSLKVQGFHLPRRHSSVIFGDGGAAKSYTALYIAGRLAEQGMSVAVFDWELAGEDHRDRLERLFPGGMPRVMYARCERPLIHEADRLRRIAQDEHLDYAIFDSVAFACDGAPEEAETASAYFRAVRQIGVGSLHLAHISKAEGGDKKPFGSAFWHNGARSTWFVKKAGGEDGEPLNLGFFNRKSNLGPLQFPVGFQVEFGPDTTAYTRTEVADCPDMSGQLTVRQKMSSALRKGSLTPQALAEEIDVDLGTVKRTFRRNRTRFEVLPGGAYCLRERDRP